MSLFTKIKGGIRFAIAAQANKRFTDASLSGSLNAELFKFGQIGRYGMTGTASIVAYDPVQSLLAVGTFQGIIHIFGKGITAALPLNDPVAIKFLSFKIGEPTLIVIDSKNILHIFDLVSRRLISNHFLRGVVTCVEPCVGTDWFFLGFNDGKIDAFDVSRGAVAGYQIPNLMAEWREVQRKERQEAEQQQQTLPEGAEPHHPKYRKVEMVVAIQFHPKDINQLLIGYQTGAILFNIKQNLAARVFEHSGFSNIPYTNRRMHLTVLSFRPDGAHFVAGHDDGTLIFWDLRNESKPLAFRAVYEAEPRLTPEPRGSFSQEPVYRLSWCSGASADDTFLVIAGGSEPMGIRGLHLFSFGKEVNYKIPKRQTILPVHDDIFDFVVLPWSSPWYLGTHNPLGILVVTASGALRAINFTVGQPEYRLPSQLEWISPKVVHAYLYAHVPDYVFQRLAIPPPAPPDAYPPHLPLMGGLVEDDHTYRIPSADLLITAHVDGSVRFWDASFIALRPLPHLAVHTREDLPRELWGEASAVEFCVATGECVIGMKSGALLVYRVKGVGPRRNTVETVEQEVVAAEVAEEAIEKVSVAATATADDAAPPVQLVASPQGTMNSATEPAPLGAEGPEQPVDAVAQQNTTALDTTPPSPPAQRDATIVTSPTAVEGKRLSIPRAPITSLVDKYAGDFARVVVPYLAVHVLKGTVKIVAVAEVGVFAAGDNIGNLVVVDTNAQAMLLSLNVNAYTAAELQQEGEDPAAAKLPVDKVTSLTFVKSYITEDEPTPQIRLIVGTHHGITAVHTILPEFSGYTVSSPLLVPTHKDRSRGIYATVLNLQGEVQTSVFEPAPSPRESQDDATAVAEGPVDGDDARSISTVATAATTATTATTATAATTATDESEETEATSPVLEAQAQPQEKEKQKEKEKEKDKEKDKQKAKEKGKDKDDKDSFLRRSLTRRKSEKDVTPTADLPKRSQSVKARPSMDSSKEVVPPLPTAKASIRKDSKAHEPHYFVSVSATGARVFLDVSGTRLFKVERAEGGGIVVKAGTVRIEGECCLACVLDNGKLVAYSLPKLEVIAEVDMPPTYIVERLWQSTLTQDGRLCMWTSQFEYRQYTFMTNNNIPYGESIKLFDPSREFPERPTVANTSKSWFGSVFTGDTLSIKEMDQIVGGPNRPPLHTTNRGEGAGGAEGSNLGGAFNELKMKMNERGEKLNELDAKFQEMNAASGDFLKSVREYNERQAQKKWYEF
ncbi:hypothetical protein BC937DRAFT_88196 [Endogone sp. FLAS-F59071]|nr:hypothetical protein BC937DRAFT_88196 [Endogone sp. FLAS-F59071]|eukprot:RUS18902.1 hypothetical protein BC937DRAFT_88196 [Endogone sp. FLAS-F59071]